jgi:alkyl hydroperoxide reductase subunit AhpF
MPDAPVLLVVDDDPRARGVVEGEVRKRYGADYQVIGAGPALPGIFAVGDVRRGSVKRVASAVGEGSVAIRLIHDYLRRNRN